MGEPTIGEEVERTSWRWHHELAAFVGATSLVDALYEFAGTDHPIAGVPLLMFGALAVGHAVGGSRVAGYLAHDDNF